MFSKVLHEAIKSVKVMENGKIETIFNPNEDDIEKMYNKLETLVNEGNRVVVSSDTIDILYTYEKPVEGGGFSDVYKAKISLK